MILAALRFERLERKGVTDSRESLGVYLSAPVRPGSAAARRLTALLPHKDQKIPQFLQGLRAGREFEPVSIDRVRVEVAFDFRADNPSARREMRVASPLRSHYYRTVDGHVLRGESHEVAPVEGSDHRFVAVRSPEQLLPEGVIALPTLFIAHGFVALQIDVTDEAARMAVRNWVPFLPATASPEGLIPMGRKKKKATV